MDPTNITPDQQPADPAALFFSELSAFLRELNLRLDTMEFQLRRIEDNSDKAARELWEISREQWIKRAGMEAQ